MNVKLYNQKGEKVGEVKLPSEIFDVPFNEDLVWQVIYCQMANKRKPIAHTKDRSEVKGGGRKPWSQKGTGRARVGSIRSPLWRGGGVTFGPRKERKFKKRIPKKMKRKALFCVLSEKLRRNLIVFLDKLVLEKIKTKEMVKILDNLKEKIEELKRGKTLIILPQKDEKIIKSARNIPKLEVKLAKDISVLDLLSFKNLIILKDSIKVIKETFKI